jgi:uncharacterized protein (DUF849 family)
VDTGHGCHSQGIDTRIGLEDTLHQPNGDLTEGNEALVRAARELGAGEDFDG